MARRAEANFKMDKELKSFLKNFPDEAEKALRKGLFGGGELVRNEAIQSIKEASPGRLVNRYRGGTGGAVREVVQAFPGNSPNTDTGTLVRQSHVKRKGNTVFVRFFAQYAARLELTHPFLFPALEQNKDMIKALVFKEIRKLLRKKS